MIEKKNSLHIPIYYFPQENFIEITKNDPKILGNYFFLKNFENCFKYIHNAEIKVENSSNLYYKYIGIF